MASIFRHIGLDLTTENSDPAKIRNIGDQKQRPKGNFSGLKDSILLYYDSLLPVLERQEQSMSIKKQRQWSSFVRCRLQSRGQMHVRRLDHAVKRNLRKNALKTPLRWHTVSSACFLTSAFRYTTIPQRRLWTPSQLILQFHLLSCLTPYLPLRTSV